MSAAGRLGVMGDNHHEVAFGWVVAVSFAGESFVFFGAETVIRNIVREYFKGNEFSLDDTN